MGGFIFVTIIIVLLLIGLLELIGFWPVFDATDIEEFEMKLRCWFFGHQYFLYSSPKIQWGCRNCFEPLKVDKRIYFHSKIFVKFIDRVKNKPDIGTHTIYTMCSAIKNKYLPKLATSKKFR